MDFTKKTVYAVVFGDSVGRNIAVCKDPDVAFWEWASPRFQGRGNKSARRNKRARRKVCYNSQ